jgi:Secretory lipase
VSRNLPTWIPVAWLPASGRAQVVTGIVALALVGAATTTVVVLRGGHDEARPIGTAHLGGTRPGSLISARTMPDLAGANARSPLAARVVYRSTDGEDNSGTVVSGSVFVPRGTPPAAGWPVVAIGHGTAGIDEPCAPSLSPTLDDNAPLVRTFTSRGYAVAMADYQGLGERGTHPYLDARTAAYNLIDSVRALRATFPHVSTTWGAYGGSQGGGAAWSADEQARTYAPDLHLVGAAAISPAADVTPLIDAAVAGTLTKDQAPAYVYVVESLARVFPAVHRDDYRRGSVKKNWAILSSCSAKDEKARNRAAGQIKPIDEVPVSRAAADRLRFILRKWSLPQDALSAPLAVAYGGEDTLVNSRWTDGALVRACALGGTIVRQFLPTKGHGQVDPTPAIAWLTARFLGSPVTSECPAG